jgi:hypothetical protein
MSNRLQRLILILFLGLPLLCMAQTACLAAGDLTAQGTVTQVVEYSIFINTVTNGFILGTTSQIDAGWLNDPQALLNRSVAITYCVIEGVNYILALDVGP